MSLSANLANVRARIELATRTAGRDPGSVRLLAVSKRQPVEAVREAYALGQRDFGENYVQELVAKFEGTRDLPDIRFHLIGHLQTNKVKPVVATCASVQTVDSIRLAEALARAASAPIDVHLQVNVAREAQKSGCEVEELPALVASVRASPMLSLRGLMTVPPAGDPESARPHFRALRELARELGLDDLSMGMTADLEVAVAEGATVVRVGTAIFGERA